MNYYSIYGLKSLLYLPLSLLVTPWGPSNRIRGKLFDYCSGLVSIRGELETEWVRKIVFALWAIAFFGNSRNTKNNWGWIKFRLLPPLTRIINWFTTIWGFYFQICKGIFNSLFGLDVELKYPLIPDISTAHTMYRKVG